MKPTETVPLLASLAPVAAFAPPVLIGAAIGLGLIWLFLEENEPEPPPAPEKPVPIPAARADASASYTPTPQPNTASRRITREDVAEALEYGARALTRAEGVAALQALGFQKSAAYKALSPDSRFAELLEHTADGLVEWRG